MCGAPAAGALDSSPGRNAAIGADRRASVSRIALRSRHASAGRNSTTGAFNGATVDVDVIAGISGSRAVCVRRTQVLHASVGR